jgi:hypothetical protein
MTLLTLRLSSLLRWSAVIVACHGAAFGLVDLVMRLLPGDPPEPIQQAAFFLLYIPAMALAAPLRPLLWSMKLIEAPGWFTWPKPLGFAIAYVTWVAALAAAAWLLRRRSS